MLHTCQKAASFAITLLAGLLIALLAKAEASGGDPGYGPPQDRQWKMATGMLKLRAWPWQDAAGRGKLENWLMSQKLFAVPGEKVLDQKYRINQFDIDDAKIPYLARDLRRRRGQKRFSLLFACENDSRYRLIDVYGPLTILTQSRADLVNVLKEQTGGWCNEDPDDARNAALLDAIRTPPGKGIRPEEIETVLGIMDEYWDTFYHIDVNSYVLLKNGRAVFNPPLPVSDMNQERALALMPDEWGKWRKTGDTYEIKDKDGWHAADEDWEAAPLPVGTTFDGEFSWDNTSGSPWFGASISHGSYTFRPNGTYSSSRRFQYGSGLGMSDTMGSINMYRSCNEDGGGSSFAAVGPNTDADGLFASTGTPNYVMIDNRDRVEGCGDGMAGAYKIEGYTIELQANNGVTRRLPFYSFANGGWLVIGRQWYAN